MTRADAGERLNRLEEIMPGTGALAPPAPQAPADETRDVARELAASFARMVESYREVYGLTAEEALERAGKSHPAITEQALTCPPDQVTWLTLYTLQEQDPEQALRRWEEVKQAGRGELRSGHAAARTIEGAGGSCWERAQFLAVRDGLIEALQPRDDLERLLIDQVAQFQTLMSRWQKVLVARTMQSAAAALLPAGPGKESYQPPRLTDAQATAEAAAMVERCHRLFLRSLRALQDRRRLGPPVVVRRANQVNIAQQQVNVAGTATG
jgi:hypothetical protein